MREIMKYLPLLLKYAQYLKYVPFLFSLVGLVKEAERKFREAKSGAQKLTWVREQFAAIVNAFEASGLVPAALAKALRDGAESFITAIVQVMKAAQGGVIVDDDGNGVGEVGGADNPPPFGPGGKYLTLLSEYPDRDAYKAGDVAWQNGEHAQWMVTQKGVGIGRPKAPWRIVQTFT